MLRKNIFRFTLAFSVVLLAVCSSSCFYCIGGSNVVRTENRTSQVTTFNEIELRGDFDINFEQDTIDNYEVLVEGDDNIIPYISTIVQGNRLIIEYNTSKCFNHSNDIDINIKARDLSKLIISGSGNAYSNKLITNTLDLQISGSGNINFRNDTLQTLSTNISGSGNITLAVLALLEVLNYCKVHAMPPFLVQEVWKYHLPIS
jgi:hypothetical protein